MSDDPHLPQPAPRPDRSPALRASDADRERAVEVLRLAAGDGRLDVEELDERLARAYATRTVSELDALTADLQPAPAPVATPGGAPVVRPGAGGTRSVISIMGGNDRTGRWRVAPRCLVLNVMGGADLDLNQAELSDQVTTIRVLSIMGGGQIRVPRGVDVQISKLAIMGGHDVQLDDEPPPAGAPVIHIQMLSIMGGGEIRQGPRRTRAENRRERELRRARSRELDR